jgi:hypothetical protein
MQVIPNKYNAGQKVYAIAEPDVHYIIRRYIDAVYYCRRDPDLTQKDKPFFEREILPLGSV